MKKKILIEDKASGTQLLQDLIHEGMHSVQRYEPTMDKIMRMHSVSSTIENGFVHLPDKAPWLAEFLHEMATFPNAKFDDQVDATSQALDWFKNNSVNGGLGLIDLLKRGPKALKPDQQSTVMPDSRSCEVCHGTMSQRIPGGLRCMQCGAQWLHPDSQLRIHHLNRTDILNKMNKYR